jgi:transposase
MYLSPKVIRGHPYYYILTSKRGVNKHWKETDLYLGRLDNLTSAEARAKLDEIHSLHDLALTREVEAVLIRAGHQINPSLDSLDLMAVRSYGPELALVRIAEQLDLVQTIEEHSPKGGGPSLGKMTLALAIYANQRPGSVLRFVEWYRRSPLPIFLELPPEEVTYDTALNTLDYLQPEMTRPIEAKTYARICETFQYRCERVDIDSTVVELNGALCGVLAKFGRPKKGNKSKRPQILITFFIDQKSVMLGHEVFPGNKNDSKTLCAIDKRLHKDYDAEVQQARRVVDRGYASLTNVRAMKMRKEHFLVALRAHPKRLKLLEEIGIPQKDWNEIAKGVRAASVVKGNLKWAVSWSDEVAERKEDGRGSKLKNAREKLKDLAKSVKEGRIKSRAERDQKVGAILRKFGVGKFLHIHGARKGFGFTVEETGKASVKAKEDGFQVFVTTELDMTDREVVESYRARDRIEKAIRTLKHCLGLGPIYVTTKEHVLGNIYVHALAYQLRAVMELELKEAHLDMSAEEALWELEQFQVAELAIRGETVEVIRKLTTPKGKVQTLVHVMSLAGEHGFPGVKESI